VSYFWGITFWQWFVVHTLFEMIENTPQGIYIINQWFTFWPGGKPGPDGIINIVGDTIGAVLGWYIAQQLDSYGSS
jgi:hypothetical protein